MYKHAAEPPKSEEIPLEVASISTKSPLEQATTSGLIKSDIRQPTDGEVLRELLEKNLKWSQIIYEQNRKINNKLLWSAIGSWIRVIILVVPFVLAIIFLPPFVRDFKDRYFNWLETVQTGKSPASNVNDLINLLPLNAAERDRVKAMLK